MKKAMRWVLGASLFFSVVGCESRDRDNPFDPQNSETGGEPAVIQALAGDSEVSLSWSLPGFRGIRRLDIVRVEGTEPARRIQEVTELEGEFVDRSVANGTTYAYRAVIVSEDDVLLESKSELATPGPAVPWVGDAGAGGISRLTPDGRDVTVRSLFNRSLLDLAFDRNGRLWGADFFQGQILRLDGEGRVEDAFSQFGANALAVDEVSGQIWVGSFAEQSLSRYTTGGSRNFYLQEIGLVEDLEAEPGPRGGVWVAVREGGVIEIANERINRRWSSFVWPVALVRSSEAWLWVLDRAEGTVSQIFVGSATVVTSAAQLGDPRDCTAAPDGGVYVADRGRGGIVHVGPDGAEAGFFAVPGATGVTRNPSTGDLWVVVRGEGRVEVLDSSGNSLGGVVVGGSPVKVEASWTR